LYPPQRGVFLQKPLLHSTGSQEEKNISLLFSGEGRMNLFRGASPPKRGGALFSEGLQKRAFLLKAAAT